MKNINIHCKSSIDVEQLDARKKLISDGVELQLLGDFLENNKTTKEYIEDMKDYISDIKVVHVPIKHGDDILELQMLSEKEYQNLFHRVAELSQNIAQMNKRDVLIVIHNKWLIDDYFVQKELYKSVCDFLKLELESFPNIKIGIENVVPFTDCKTNRTFCSGSFPEYAEIAKDIRKRLNTEKIGTVLDTCHAFVTIKTMRAISEVAKYTVDIDIEDYYKANEGICFLVHLCDVENMGYNKYEHGTGFDKNNKEKLVQLIELHKKYINNTDITLEVLEKDYLNCENYAKSREILKDIIGR